MRSAGRAVLLLAASMALAPLSAPVRPVAAEPAWCPNPARAKPQKVPPDLIGAVAAAFQIDNATAGSAAVVRCAGAKLMGCYVGANLNCDKADTRRTLPGATDWCRSNPGSDGIPMSATGHATIYDWSCKSGHAVAGKTVTAVDAQGYAADNWKALH